MPRIVMVVDDNSLVRGTVRRILHHAGYQVSDWADPVAALEHLKSGDQVISLVLIDGVMPQMTGNLAAVEIRRLKPHLPIMLMSGHEAGEFKDVVGKPGYHYIAKPFVAEDLISRIRGIIG